MNTLKAEAKKLNYGNSIYMGRVSCYQGDKRIWCILTGIIRMTEDKAIKDAEKMTVEIEIIS